jgi:hypothetical protein
VRELLLEFQATMPTVEDNAMLVLMKMLDEPQESAPDLPLNDRATFASGIGSAPDGKVRGDARLRRLPRPLPPDPRCDQAAPNAHQYPATAIFESIDNGGWSALRFASDVLGYYAAEGSLTKDQEADYLAQVRAVIDAVASDEALSPSDRSRIV